MKKLNQLRFWVINKLLTEDEKYLITRAIVDRVSNLQKIAVTETWADKENIYDDCADYIKLKKALK